MIFLVENMIVQGDVKEKIEKWTVFFRGPFGITPDLRQAVDWCNNNDMPPDLTIETIPVACGATLKEPDLRHR